MVLVQFVRSFLFSPSQNQSAEAENQKHRWFGDGLKGQCPRIQPGGKGAASSLRREFIYVATAVPYKQIARTIKGQ